MTKGVIAKKQVFGLLVVFIVILLLVLASAPIVQASTGGTGMEPIPNTQSNPSGSGIDDPLLGLLFSIISLLL